MHPPHKFRRAFSLIELLVVIGIVAVLAAILVPMVMRSMRQGGRIKTAADLNTIAIALEAYKQDFGDIPRVPYNQPDVGAAVLGMALVGPYGDGFLPAPPNPVGTNDADDPPPYDPTKAYRAGECVVNLPTMYVCIVATSPGTPTSDPNHWAPFSPRDGADGPGFRSRVVNGVPQGKVWGPYLKPENFRMTGLALNDGDGKPILYFPASGGAANVNSPRGFIDREVQTRALGTPIVPKYNADNNLKAFRRLSESVDDNAIARIQVMLGDMNTNGGIDSLLGTEAAAATGPFILWAAGPDGQFGPNDVIDNPPSATDWQTNRRLVEKCDDVTNFR